MSRAILDNSVVTIYRWFKTSNYYFLFFAWPVVGLCVNCHLLKKKLLRLGLRDALFHFEILHLKKKGGGGGGTACFCMPLVSSGHNPTWHKTILKPQKVAQEDTNNSRTVVVRSYAALPCMLRYAVLGSGWGVHIVFNCISQLPSNLWIPSLSSVTLAFSDLIAYFVDCLYGLCS